MNADLAAAVEMHTVSQVKRHHGQCNATDCGGKSAIFYYKWCNQYRMRCEKCGKSIWDMIFDSNRAPTPCQKMPVQILCHAIPHKYIPIIRRSFPLISFESYAEVNEHIKPKAKAFNTLF